MYLLILFQTEKHTVLNQKVDTINSFYAKLFDEEMKKLILSKVIPTENQIKELTAAIPTIDAQINLVQSQIQNNMNIISLEKGLNFSSENQLKKAFTSLVQLHTEKTSLIQQELQLTQNLQDLQTNYNKLLLLVHGEWNLFTPPQKVTVLTKETKL